MGAKRWNSIFVIGLFLIFIVSCNKDEDDIYKKEAGTFTDSRDQRVYKWVKIGDQIWMAENLAYLPNVSPPSVESVSDPIYYVYDYNGTNLFEAKATENYSCYGVLYNWPAAKTACPAGWHLPAYEEWTALSDFLIKNGYGFGGSGPDIAKALAAKTNWNNFSVAGSLGFELATNDSSGFSALPGGYRYGGGTFYYLDYHGVWWTSTENNYYSSMACYLYFNSAFLNQDNDYKQYGFSVRCVKD